MLKGDGTIKLHLADLLKWEGALSNHRVRELFNLKITRASQWLRDFADEHPDWVRWDTRSRAYIATSAAHKESEAANVAASFVRYRALVSSSPGISDALSSIPILGAPSSRIFSCLQMAIRQESAVSITYQSMTEPVPHERLISPHRLVNAGRRWHVRAYCHKRNDFRDFALGRIESARIQDAEEAVSADNDKNWRAQITVRLVAHPGLTHEQQQVVRAEYFEGLAARADIVRGPLIPYYIQDIRAAVDTSKQTAPDYQLAVENAKEVLSWMFKE